VRKTDISKFSGARNTMGDHISTGKSVWGMFLKAVLTILIILLIAGVIVFAAIVSFIYSLKDSSIDFDLHKLQLNYTSFIYVNGPDDDSAHPVKYASICSDENRIWVDYDKIPQAMKDAIVSIEDKRFWEHKGVDWQRTFSAAANLFHLIGGNSGSYGGSTITQQLIKNITGDNEVSLTRKVTEIFRALNLEKKYTKQEILTAYLNVVNFGNGCDGVQSAANLYFGKNIEKCDIAQCAAIAGITQNPTANNPFLHPEANKKRQQIVLKAMHDQGRITDAEYQSAVAESEHMAFVGKKEETVVDENDVWNWYTDAMIEDVKDGLMKAYNCSSSNAINMIYHGGLSIYSAMNQNMQQISESAFSSSKVFPSSYPNLQGGYLAMDYSGRVMAIVGMRGKKTGNRWYNNATDAKRQPGSSIKPLAVYGPAINLGIANYSTLLSDEPQANWSGNKAGPKNWDRVYHGNITVDLALRKSYNAAAISLFKKVTPAAAFDFMTKKLGFTSLEPTDKTLAMGIGGLTKGVTVREMTAGFQIFGDGGKYYQPYTYYYVTDHDGNVVLDNRNEVPTQAISSSASTIMNKLLRRVVTNGTGTAANISGWDCFGKTGTTDAEKDSWFVGGSPYAVAGVWTGYKTPKKLDNGQASVAKKVWKTIMENYLKGKKKKDFTFDSNVVSAVYCQQSGLLANSGVCTQTGVGWYDKNNLPATCDISHAGAVSSSPSSGAESGVESALPESQVPETSSAPIESGAASETQSEPENSVSGSQVSPESEMPPNSSAKSGKKSAVSGEKQNSP